MIFRYTNAAKMKNALRIFLAVIGSLTCQLKTFAQVPNYSGTWILNLEKSKLEHRPSGLTSSIFVIEQEGDKFKLTRYHVYGDKKKKISFRMTADGKTKKVKMLFKAKLEKRENSLQATVWRKNFSNIVNYKFGDNQNELIADEVFSSKHNHHHNIWIFQREIPEMKIKSD